MYVEMDPFIDALILSTVMSSLDKMGLNPMLVARQGARIIAPTIGAGLQQTVGSHMPTSLEDHCKVSEDCFKAGQTADPDKTKVSCSDNVITMKVVDCAYLTMADFGKSLGYEACPICVQAFMESALTTAVKIAETESFQVEHSADTCIVKIKLIEK